MNTYTLTQAQYDKMYAIGEFASGIREILRLLKPNLQEPVARVDDLERGGRIRAMHLKLGLDAELFDHPAPMSKEDMVKVLEALTSAPWKNYKTNKAITIMQSAIERMK
jgi:hypothetical protein